MTSMKITFTFLCDIASVTKDMQAALHARLGAQEIPIVYIHVLTRFRH